METGGEDQDGHIISASRFMVIPIARRVGKCIGESERYMEAEVKVRRAGRGVSERCKGNPLRGIKPKNTNEKHEFLADQDLEIKAMINHSAMCDLSSRRHPHNLGTPHRILPK